MTPQHQDRMMRIILFVSSAETIGELLGWWRTGHLSPAMAVSLIAGAVVITVALLRMRLRALSRRS